MAVKSQSSFTVVDLTDGFSVALSQDSVAWNGGVSTLGTAQQVVITVSAFQGSTSASFTLGTCSRSDSTNCTASVSGSTVTVNVAAAATSGGTVTIPVNISSNGDTVTINKTFSYSIAFKGNPGQNGEDGHDGQDGENAINLSITADTSVIRNNNNSAVLTAHVFYGATECNVATNGTVTVGTGQDAINLGSIKWYVGTSSTAAATAKTYTVTAAAVTNYLTVNAKLEA